ncbi:WD40-repeat-containing domain protein [Polychytrium aggregatum]|uniref:WD40-repeat-containing domain protein n=1 Tax=Polychytrium aggregatum TaxID=110093 RepID=UPI0022FE0EE0|nr:WD40-repeat-containing domain protein [Polychytrium aggregatum]KAI9193757.1 WD40-repeat-containing domain protein [Polychytrium aggregatum]
MSDAKDSRPSSGRKSFGSQPEASPKAKGSQPPKQKRDVKAQPKPNRHLQASKKYDRNPTPHALPLKNIEDRKLKGTLKKTFKRFEDASIKAAQSELLLPEEAGYLEAEGMERTFKFTQDEISKHVDINTSAKMFDLQLPDFGPYAMDYTRNGRHILIGGRKGHVATFDWKTGRLGCELHLKETVRDVKWLHNETMFAVAQKKYTYIYDNTGLEIHCLRKHIDVNKLDFLPYHFLLVSVGTPGWILYQDTSTGKLVAEWRTKLGPCNALAQNPYNGIMTLGHSNGTVTMWSPTMSEPLVKMLCHKGPVQAIAVDRGGYYMATSGLDGQMKIWDIRTYKCLNEYFTATPASTLSISQKGLLAVGYGPNIQVWKDAFITKQKAPYMTHLMPGSVVQDLNFCPYEDVLGIGHSRGISSIVIPGSGEPNFDTFEANPYQTKKQRQESEVHSLLDKLQPETIALNPNLSAPSIAPPKRSLWRSNDLSTRPTIPRRSSSPN